MSSGETDPSGGVGDDAEGVERGGAMRLRPSMEDLKGSGSGTLGDRGLRNGVGVID